jgi:hypothetical protein
LVSVDVFKLEDHGGLLDDECDAGAERDRESAIELLAEQHDRRAARGEGQRNPGT